MNRIQKCFEGTRAAGRPAFIAYLTMGYPTLAASEDAADTLLANGADILVAGSAVFGAPDVTARTEEFCKLIHF